MIDHPVPLFIFCLANLVSAVGFSALGIGVIPRSRLHSRPIKIAGMVAMIGSALAHLMLMFAVLFRPDVTPVQVSGEPPMLIVHALIAAGLWIFMVGIFLQIGRDMSAHQNPADVITPDDDASS